MMEDQINASFSEEEEENKGNLYTFLKILFNIF